MATTNQQNLVDVLSAARRYEAAAEIALRVQDAWTATRAADRLEQTLSHAVMLLSEEWPLGSGAESCVKRGMARTMLREATERMYELVRTVSAMRGSDDAQRAKRWEEARRSSPASFDGPQLFELDAGGRTLEHAEFISLHVQDSRLITDLTGARFEDALIDDCDFTYANLSTSMWRRSYVRRSFLRESLLVDAAFDQTTFVDCDLRRVDFTAREDRAGKRTGELRFIKCDLRGADLTGRRLEQVKAYDCRLHGLRGIDAAHPLQVRRADLSPWGNGSNVIAVDRIEGYVSDPLLADPSVPASSGCSENPGFTSWIRGGVR